MDKSAILYDVSVKRIQPRSDVELSETFYHNCLFCEKLVRVSPVNFQSCMNLGGGKFYCPFCLRNDFHHRDSRNVLIMSYRSIIGHYYYKHHLDSESRMKMWISQITELIHRHERTGLSSPAFSYDPSTYLWFIDFNKVGNHHRKAPFEDIAKIASLILDCFELEKTYGSYVQEDLWKKYEKALKLFYEKRQRPKDRRMLIPTLQGVVNRGFREDYHEKTREFVPEFLQTK